MKYNPDIHHRRSIRLKDYDYSQSGAYFVTICNKNKECLFGDVVDRKMRLNEMGIVVQQCWNVIPEHFPNTVSDEFIVMPNHIHGIIVIVGAQFIAPFGKTMSGNQGVMNHAPTTAGEIVRAFKARCTYAINQVRITPGMPLWQRNYYEHIIRNEPELNKIREYIINNPLNWESDENYNELLSATSRISA